MSDERTREPPGHGDDLGNPVWRVEWESDGRHNRMPLSDTLTVGRSPAMDIVINDPYVSRQHCVITLKDGRPWVDARKSLNRVRFRGREIELAVLEPNDAFQVGSTELLVTAGTSAGDATLLLHPASTRLYLRVSIRELRDADETLIARLSASECRLMEALAARYPDAASHETLGRAVWGEDAYDRYLIHRLVQRIRTRLGDRAAIIDNVRGGGYRLLEVVTLS